LYRQQRSPLPDVVLDFTYSNFSSYEVHYTLCPRISSYQNDFCFTCYVKQKALACENILRQCSVGQRPAETSTRRHIVTADMHCDVRDCLRSQSNGIGGLCSFGGRSCSRCCAWIRDVVDFFVKVFQYGSSQNTCVWFTVLVCGFLMDECRRFSRR
jgi:hypothetical protein